MNPSNSTLTVVAYSTDPELAYALRKAVLGLGLPVVSSTIQVGPGGYPSQPILRQHLRFRCVMERCRDAEPLMFDLMRGFPVQFWCRVKVEGPGTHRSEFTLGKLPKKEKP